MRNARRTTDVRLLQVRGGRAGLRRGGRSRRHRGAGRRPARRGRTSTSTCCARSGLEKGDSVAAVLPNGVKPVEVYLAALQAGWYYVPINYRLSAPEIAYIIQDSGAKAIVSARALRRGDRGGRRRGGRARRRAAGPRRRPRLPRRRGRARGAARHAPRRPRRRRRHALHVGHHRQAQGREAQALRLRSRRDGRAVHRLLQPLRHPPPRGPGAPLHLAELPHRRHDLRRQRAQLRAPGRVHGQVGSGADARQDRAVQGHPHPHGPDAVPPDAAAARRREGRSTTCRR